MKGKLKAVKIVGHEKSTYDRSADDLVIAVIKLAYEDCVKRHDRTAYKFFKDNYEVIPKQISDRAIKIYEEREGIYHFD